MAPYDRNSGSNKTGQAALPHKNIHFEDDVMKMSAFSSKTQKNTWKYRIYDTTCSFKNVIKLLDIVSSIEFE